VEEKEKREAREGEVGGVVWVEGRLDEVTVLGREEERELVGGIENLESGFR